MTYFNFCSDPGAAVVSAAASWDPTMASRSSSPRGAGASWKGGFEQHGFKVRFSSTEKGAHEATVRFVVSHGYYETRFRVSVD